MSSIEQHLMRKWIRESADTKQRTCLMCGKSFASPGPGVRRCNKCNTRIGVTMREGRDVVSFHPPKDG